MTDHPQDFGFGLKPDDRRVIASATDHSTRLTDDFERLKQLQESEDGGMASGERALADVEAWLRRHPRQRMLEDDDGPAEAEQGETVLDAIERCAGAVAS